MSATASRREGTGLRLLDEQNLSIRRHRPEVGGGDAFEFIDDGAEFGHGGADALLDVGGVGPGVLVVVLLNVLEFFEFLAEFTDHLGVTIKFLAGDIRIGSGGGGMTIVNATGASMKMAA